MNTHPTAVAARATEGNSPAGRRQRTPRRPELHRYGTLIFFLLFYLIIGVREGDSYLSWSNVSLVLGNNSHLAFLAAAAVTTLIAGQFDLSIGAVAGVSAVMVAQLTATGHGILPSIGLCVLFGVAAGLLNAFLVVKLQINAFIATLGTGGAFTGISQWISSGQTIFSGIPERLTNAGSGTLLEIPYPALYVLVMLGIMWALTRKVVLGRWWYATGANAEAARLAGVRTGRATMWAFVATGVLASLGGVISTARFASADPTTGSSLLLPAFAAAFLGASILSNGGFTVVGAVAATFLLQFAVNGLDVSGFNLAIKPIFNGMVLIGAVALTEFLRRRKRPTRATIASPSQA